MPARTPMRPFATARRKLAAKTISRSPKTPFAMPCKAALPLEQRHRAAAAGLGDIERRQPLVVADIDAHVFREQVVDERDVVMRDRGVQGRVAQPLLLRSEEHT